MDRLSRQYDKRGCSRCGKRPSIGAFAATEDDRVLCPGCVGPGDRVFSVGANLVETRSDGAEDDRQWFAAHLGERYRVRPAFDGEAAELIARDAYIAMLRGEPFRAPPVDPETLDTIVTMQLSPGKRVRAPVRLPQDPEAVPGFVAEVVAGLDAIAEHSLSVTEALPPGQLAMANNAAALLPIDAAALGGKITSQARETGAAFRESVGKPRH